MINKMKLKLRIRIYKGVQIIYPECFYLAYEVNEQTGNVTDKLVVHFTKDQMFLNAESIAQAYLSAIRKTR